MIRLTNIGLTAALVMPIWLLGGSSVHALCSCQGAAIDSCLPGTWAMGATQFGRITDGLLADVPGQVEWASDGQVVVTLGADGNYRSQLEGMSASMAMAAGPGMVMEMAGSTAGTYCAAGGKLCFQETTNDLTMNMVIPGSDLTMATPIGDEARQAAIDVDYLCSADTVTVDVPHAATEAASTFDLTRR